ncbi:MAG: aminotransferase DegT [Myxococcales bacterium]|jgi:UDP-2-acetamido-2-deoxy-ribo-hexuluronate aminotransferase|nr:aminotransferase DegT [Myxococcales bacterium]
MQFIDLKSQYQAYRQEIDAGIARVLEHGRYIMGPEIEAMEKQLAEMVGQPHAISCASGTDALLLALMALGVGEGDEVVTVGFTFIATAEVISLLGATPVFVDICEDDYGMDPQLLEAAITERTRAIIPVSLYGQVCRMGPINTVAKTHGIPVIEDGAQSLGALQDGRMSCGLSTLSATSFFPSKPLGCYGDGGALFTDDDDLARVCKELRAHGQERRYVHTRIGVNARMDAIQAAVILGKLPHFENEMEKRSTLGARYTEALKDIVRTPKVLAGNRHVYAQYSIEVDDREAFRAHMQTAGVPTAVHYPVPLHLQEAFRYLGLGPGHLPRSERVSERIVSLPMSPFLTLSDQDHVIGSVREFFGA